MKINIGQWVRDENNNIYEWKNINEVRAKNIDYDSHYLSTLKVADTPQELVRDGDLIKSNIENGTFEVRGFSGGGRVLLYGGKITCLIEITAIYTQNSKGDFIKQWEAEQ